MHALAVQGLWQGSLHAACRRMQAPCIQLQQSCTVLHTHPCMLAARAMRPSLCIGRLSSVVCMLGTLTGGSVMHPSIHQQSLLLMYQRISGLSSHISLVQSLNAAFGFWLHGRALPLSAVQCSVCAEKMEALTV